MFQRLSLLTFIFFLCFVQVSFAADWTIEGNRVWQNDSNCYISVEPHTLSSSGWSEVTFKSHNFIGNIDVCYGFNTIQAVPRSPAWKNHWENTFTNHQAYFYNVTDIQLCEDCVCDYGNTYNIHHKTVTYHRSVGWNEETNTTKYELDTVNVCFDLHEQTETNYTCYWHTDHSNWVTWTPISNSRYHSITYDFLGFNKWYYATDLNVTAGVEYQTRIWLDIPISLKSSSGKYFFGIKPSSETLAEAIANDHFYYIDPWWDASWNNKREIKIDNTGGSALSYYQMFVNLTDTPINATSLRVINEAADAVVPHWNETVTDGNVTKLWFNATSIPASSWLNETYYIYYGNNASVSTSDGDETFGFFDEFIGSNINTTKWINNLNGGYAVSGGLLDLDPSGVDGASSGPTGIVTKTAKFNPQTHVIRMRHKSSTIGNIDKYSVTGWNNVNNDPSNSDNSYSMIRFNPSGSRAWDIETRGRIGAVDQTADTCCDNWYSQNTFYIFEGRNEGTHLIASVDEVDKTDTNDPENNDLTDCYVGMNVWNDVHFYWDWILVRKYASPEPTATLGEETRFSLGIPYTPKDLTSTVGMFWVNYTWLADQGEVAALTDSYNVSVNGIWNNGSALNWSNTTINICEWVNITVWAYNNTYNNLSLNGVLDQQQVLCDYPNYVLYNELQDLKEENEMIGNAIVYVFMLLFTISLVFYSWMTFDTERYTTIIAAGLSAVLFFVFAGASAIGDIPSFEYPWAVMLLTGFGLVQVLTTFLLVMDMFYGKLEDTTSL